MSNIYIKYEKLIFVILLIAIGSLIGLKFIFFSNKTPELLNIGKKKNFITDNSIKTYKIKLKNIKDELKILGQVVFQEKVSLSSKVNGRIIKIYIKEGDKVRTGQLIAEIERLPLKISLQQQMSELNITRKSYALTKAKYENALKSIEIKLKTILKAKADVNDKWVTHKNMNRVLKNKNILFKAGGVSQSEISNLEAQHTTLKTKYILAKSDYEIQRVGYRESDIIAEGYKVPKSEKEKIKLLKRINTKIERAELDAARSKIYQAKNNIKSTRLMVRETYIRSPINGVVASKQMETGEMVKQDSIIATLIKISNIFITMNVNEKNIQKIKIGQDVAFTVDAIGAKVFHARIRSITPVLDIKTRTIEIKAIMKNPGNLLLPGMFARAAIKVGDSRKKLVLPVSSLLNREKNSGEVYLIKKGIAFKTKVKLGTEHDSFIEIVKGIKENDTIISEGIHTVYPGMKINLNND